MWDLKQCSPSWGKLRLGNSLRTLCDSGCLVTCLSALSEWYGKFINPGKLVSKLSFTPGGYYNWKSGDTVFPFTFVYRYYQRDDVKIKEIINSKDNACILQIPLAGGTHWVVALSYNNVFGYKIFDPLKGDITYLNIRYKFAKIIGFAEITRK